MRMYGVISGLILAAVLLSGCTESVQDEQFKELVSQVDADLQAQQDLIIKPYQGIAVDQILQYRSAARSAIAAAEALTLSEKAGKARNLFIEGMNATITAVDTLEEQGKLRGSDGKVTTEPVNSLFITTQTKIDDTCSLIGIERKKTF